MRKTLALMMVLAGCGDDGTSSSGSDSASGTDSGDTETSGTDSNTSTSGPGTGSGSESATSTTSSSAGTDSGGSGSSSGGSTSVGSTGTTGTTGGANCPDAGDATATVHVTPFDQSPMDWLDLACLVEGVTAAGGTTTVDLECGGGVSMPVKLEVTMAPGADWPIAQGDNVVLDYEIDQPWWLNRWITVRAGTPAPEGLSTGGIIFAAMDGTQPNPWGVDDFYSPLVIEKAAGDCTPMEDDSMCGLRERVGISVTDGDASDTFWDRTGGDLGPMASYKVAVGEAVEYSEVVCDDFAESWYRAALLRTPGG